MASIEDVARVAGVSVATVSRALRGLPNVAPSTRSRVLRAAEGLAYVADPHASRLAAGRSGTVGLVVPILSQWYYARLFAGVEGALSAAGLDVLPYVTAGADGFDRFVTTKPFRKRVDGLIVVDASYAEEQLEEIVASGVAVVTIGSRTARCSSLNLDDVRAARAAVTHLTGLGHRRIGLITGYLDDPLGFTVPVDRRRGYEAALAVVGVAPDPDLVVAGGFALAGGAEAMETLLHLDDRPTAVFAMTDDMAIGALQVARDAGVAVPKDLSVVGFDDQEVAEYLGLTTVRQDVMAVGERAVRVLMETMRNPDPACAIHEVVRGRLVVRTTTGPASNASDR